MSDDMELIHGSGNVFRDFGYPGADVRQAKALLAAQVINILDEEKLSTRQAEARTGVSSSGSRSTASCRSSTSRGSRWR